MIITIDEALESQQGVERVITCPAGTHDDRNPSASLNVDKGVWYCFSCGAAGVIDGVRKPPTVKQLQDMLAGELEPPVKPDGLLDVYDAYVPSHYWVKRVGLRTAREFRCGTDPVSGCPTYPIHSPDGKLWGIVKRTGGRPKYVYPAGVSVSHTLFGLHRVRRRPKAVVLLEGAGDVMAVHRAAGELVVPLGVYGSHVKAVQSRLLEKLSPSTIVLGFDSDSAGESGAEHAASVFADRGHEIIRIDWSSAGANDPGELPPPAVTRLVKDAIETRRK